MPAPATISPSDGLGAHAGAVDLLDLALGGLDPGRGPCA